MAPPDSPLMMHPMIQKMVPRFSAAIIIFYIGIALLLRGEQKITLSAFLEEFGWSAIGVMVIAISIAYIAYLVSTLLQIKKEDRFIDVDDKRKPTFDISSIERIKSEIEELKHKQPNVDYAKIEELIKKSTVPTKVADADLVKSFENYFNGIRATLEEKADIADKKASILLDKGTAYSKGGITFFVFSIVAWQVLSWIKGFEQQFIYGIASCSVLFIFIEFLSAWFLKQYRQFVDTSTYLIKVKSIFDKYMLAYLVMKEASGEQKEKLLDMVTLLRDEIKWPETYLLKNGDISFAKETMETMTYLVRSLREAAKDSKKSNESSN